MAQVAHLSVDSAKSEKHVLLRQDPGGAWFEDEYMGQEVLARINTMVEEWANDHEDMIPLGAEDPLVLVIRKFIQFAPPLNQTAATIAAACILLAKTFDATISVTAADLAGYFETKESNIVWYFHQQFQRYTSFTKNQTCIIRGNGQSRRIHYSTPFNVVVGYFRLPTEAQNYRVATMDRQVAEYLVPGTEYYIARYHESQWHRFLSWFDQCCCSENFDY